MAAAGACVVPASAGAQEATRCPPAPAPPPAGEELPAGTPRGKPDPKAARIAFGSKRGTTDRTITRTATPRIPAGGAVTAEVSGDLLRAEEGDSFPQEAVVVSASRTGTGNLRLAICLDPKEPEEVGPGRYSGGVELSGTGVEDATIPLEVTLKASIWEAIAWIAAGVLIGVILKSFADLRASLGKTPSWTEFRAYLKQPAVVIAVLFGFAAAVVALGTDYGGNEAWGTMADGGRLFAGAILVQVTGMTVVDFFKQRPTPSA